MTGVGHFDVGRARRDGNGLVITGSKTWISNARRSGLIALLCKTDPDARPRHAGISVVLVESPPDAPPEGLTISRDLPKLGYKGVESCELSFADYRIPASAILGGVPGRGFAQMMKGLGYGAGYYDMTIARLRGMKRITAIGIAFAAQEVSDLPKTDHDEKLDFVLTEREIIDLRT